MIPKIIFLFFFLNSLFISQNVRFYGEAKPGNLMIGAGDNISKVLFDNKELLVDKSGVFVFGFDRDAKGEHVLKIYYDNKEQETFSFLLEKREYGKQHLTIAQKFITPPKKELSRIKMEAELIDEARSKIGKINDPFFMNGFVFPVKENKITGLFGVQRILNNKPHNVHNGVDFAGNIGDSVFAIADGIVQLIGENFYYNGNFVLIDHGQGLSTIYIHLNNVFVKNGEKVSKGKVIGEVGSTGRSTGPHLHLGVQWYNKRIDPMSLFSLIIK